MAIIGSIPVLRQEVRDVRNELLSKMNADFKELRRE
jgi:hypothetical protein